MLAGKHDNNKIVCMLPLFKMSLIRAIVGQVLFLERQEARTTQRELYIVIPRFFPLAGCVSPAKWCTVKLSKTRQARQPCRKAVYVWDEPSYKQGRTIVVLFFVGSMKKMLVRKRSMKNIM